MKLAILGCGQMGEALLKGLLAAYGADAVDAAITTKFDDHEQELRSRYPRMLVTQDNSAAVKGRDVVVLAVNPDAAREVLMTLGTELEGKLLVCICAGIPTDKIRSWAPSARVVRGMPNLPCQIRQGTIALATGEATAEADINEAKELFSKVGMCLEIKEKYMDIVTALAASGPAFAFVILEALADGAVMVGLPRKLAARLTAQMIQGSARLLLETGAHPAELKDQVTTPGGITTAGLLEMEDGRIRSTLARTVQKAASRAQKLGED